jgi:hypothetical protein
MQEELRAIPDLQLSRYTDLIVVFMGRTMMM